MADINEARQQMMEELQRKIQTDSKLSSIRNKIQNGDYSEASQYGMRSGEILSEVIRGNITEELFQQCDVKGLGEMLLPVIKQENQYVSNAVSAAQKAQNAEVGIGIKPLQAERDLNSYFNIFGKMKSSDYESFEQASWLLDEPIVHDSLSIVDDTLKENADFQYKSGLRTCVIRDPEPDCCDWCAERAGTYYYPDVPDSVWERHNNCLCEIRIETEKDDNNRGSTSTRRDSRISGFKDESEIRKQGKLRNNKASDEVSILYQKPSGELRELAVEIHQSRDTLSIPEIYNDNFGDYKPINYTEEEIETVKELYRLGKESNYEYARILWEDGSSDYLTSHLHDQVGFNLSDYDHDNLRIFHCHTNITPPSIDDYYLFVNEKVSEVSNIAANGDCFSVTIGPGIRPTKEEFNKAREMIEDWVIDDIKNNPLYKDLTEKEKNYTAIREASLRFARYFEWDTYGGRLNE